MRSIVTALLLISSFHAKAAFFATYGEDNRRDVNKETDPKLLELSRSVVAMVDKKHLKLIGSEDGKFLDDYSTRYNMCEGEAFRDQVRLATCSGVLIAPDKILTANHCVTNELDCKDQRFVFDLKLEKDPKKIKIKRKNIYSCKAIEKFSSHNAYDYSIILLDRKVKGRKPVTIARETLEIKKDELAVIGHPMGLPMKISDSGFVWDYFKNGYSTNLDTYSGNSGSPVFKKSTGEMIGHIAAGKTDFVLDRENNCLKSNKCDDDGSNCDITEFHMEYVIEAKHLPNFSSNR